MGIQNEAKEVEFMIAVAFAPCGTDHASQHAAAVALRDRLIAAAGLDPDAYVHTKTEKGKPYAMGAPFTYSLSHSGRLCCCALSYAGDAPLLPLPDAIVRLFPGSGDVGVDIEYIDPEKDLPRLQKIAVRYLPGSPEITNAAAFYAAWTRLEACGKCTGDGIFAPSRSDDMRFDTFTVEHCGERYAVSIARKTG